MFVSFDSVRQALLAGRWLPFSARIRESGLEGSDLGGRKRLQAMARKIPKIFIGSLEQWFGLLLHEGAWGSQGTEVRLHVSNGSERS